MSRFKQFCRDHDISVGTITAALSFIGWLAGYIVAGLQNVTEFGNLPTWAMAAIAWLSLAMMWIGRYAGYAAKMLGGRKIIVPTLTDITAPADPSPLIPTNQYPDEPLTSSGVQIFPADFTPDPETVAALGADAFTEGHNDAA